MKTSRYRYAEVRGLRYHLTEWGEPDAPKIFMLHGWTDVGATFQFLVDALQREWHVIAPDWRGFGRTRAGGDCFWFPDYLADLDVLAGQCAPGETLRLVGHSMGGNVACLYAGVRPNRVSHVVAIDAFGLADRPPEEAPGRYEKWLDELSRPVVYADFASFDALAIRLRSENPRLDEGRARFLAQALAVGEDGGRIVRLAEPAHRRVNPVLYRRAEAMACWRRATATVMWIVPEMPELRRRMGVDDAAYADAKACFRNFRELTVSDAGHNLHHDRPEVLAAAIEAFLDGSGEDQTR